MHRELPIWRCDRRPIISWCILRPTFTPFFECLRSITLFWNEKWDNRLLFSEREQKRLKNVCSSISNDYTSFLRYVGGVVGARVSRYIYIFIHSSRRNRPSHRRCPSMSLVSLDRSYQDEGARSFFGKLCSNFRNNDYFRFIFVIILDQCNVYTNCNHPLLSGNWM